MQMQKTALVQLLLVVEIGKHPLYRSKIKISSVAVPLKKRMHQER